MGSYDGAQFTDLVGLMILSKIEKEFKEIKFSLYRDDGLGYHTSMSNQKLDRIRKRLHNFFKQFELQITVETGLKKVDFLDVSFDLNDGTYQPYRKPNDTPVYVHKESNHPKHVLNNIPKAINKRLTELSSNKNKFDKSKTIYQEALTRSGYNFTLCYQPNNVKNTTTHDPDSSLTSPSQNITLTSHTHPTLPQSLPWSPAVQPPIG